MNETLVTELFTKGILAVRDDSPLDCIEVLEGGTWKYGVSRINWKLAEDSRGLPFSEVFQLLGDLIDEREGTLSLTLLSRISGGETSYDVPYLRSRAKHIVHADCSRWTDHARAGGLEGTRNPAEN
jgi:hypothetical protein